MAPAEAGAAKWTCTECGWEHGPEVEVCDFCETPRGGGFVAAAQAGVLADEPWQKVPAKSAQSGGEAAAEEARPVGQEADSRQDAEDAREMTPEEAELWISERKQRLWQELRDLDAYALAERRKRLRQLQLELHPDKQRPELRTHTKQLFVIVQTEWEAVQKAWRQQSLQQPRQQRRREEERAAQAPKQPQQRREKEQAQAPPQEGPDAGAPSGPGASAEQRASPPEDRGASEPQGAEEEPDPGEEAEEPQEEEEEAAEEEPPEFNRPSSDSEAEPQSFHTEEDDRPWTDARIDAAEAACWRREDERERKELQGRHLRTKTWDPCNPLSFPLELRIADPTNPDNPPGGHLYTVNARRTWLAGDVKEVLQSMTGITRFIQRLLVEKENNVVHELEDDETLADLPGGLTAKLTLGICPALYCDYAYVLKAVRHSWRAMQWSPLCFRADPTLMYMAVRHSWQALRLASRELRADGKLVWIAVRQDGLALEHASEKLRSNRELALEAVRGNWRALEFVGTKPKADRDIILCAVKQDPDALRHASPGLLADRKLIQAAIRLNPRCLQHAKTLRGDRELVRDAVGLDPLALEHASMELRSDRQLVLSAVRRDGRALEFAAQFLRDDPGIIAAVHGKREALQFVKEEFRRDADGSVFDTASDVFGNLADWQERIRRNIGMAQAGRPQGWA